MPTCMSSGNTDNNKLRLWETGLPGFRFSPTEQELVGYYLRRAAEGRNAEFSQLIVTVDLYKHDPWNLPALAPMGDMAWLFLVPRDRKYPNGSRPNRVTKSGYWKATGTDRQVVSSEGQWSSSPSSQCIGLKKTLVFYQGKAPNGVKTPWIMNEYRLNDWEYHNCQTDVTLCRVHLKGLPRTWALPETPSSSLTTSSTDPGASPSMTPKREEEPSAFHTTVPATQTNHAQHFDGPASNAMLYGFNDFAELGEQQHCQGPDRNMINDNVNSFSIVNSGNNNGPSSMDHLLATLMDDLN